MEKITLRVDEEGKVTLPESLISRLCLKNSFAAPLLETNGDFYIMPSAITALLMESKDPGDDVFDNEEEGDELTDEEIDQICFDYRYGDNKV